MERQDSPRTCAGQEFAVGLDVHLRSWSVAVREGGRLVAQWRMPPAPEQLLTQLRHRYPGGRYVVAYEAGYSGFWAQRALSRLGCACLVVNPADIASTDQERRRKTDRRDAARLARELAHGALRPLTLPPPELDDLRQLCRLRGRLVSHATRLKLRLKAFLALDGIALPAARELGPWSNRFLAWLEAQAAHSLRPAALTATLAELRAHRVRQVQVTRQLRALLRAAPAAQQDLVRLLQSIPGIGQMMALTLLTEVVDIHRFARVDRFISFCGLACDSHSSGEQDRHLGLTRRGHPVVRHLLIEAAWVAIRHDPSLRQHYQRARQHLVAPAAIVPVARQLAVRVRAVWRDHRPYTFTANEEPALGDASDV